MKLKKIIKLFERGNVCVVGLRGTGKDMLIANVLSRQNPKQGYISNVDYNVKARYLPLDFQKLDVGNNYKDFISGNIKPFFYSYPEKADIYLSDAGVYFPSQYCSELNRDYKNFPVFQALSRQIANCNFHINVQNLNRVWDKIREQSDIYIRCKRCVVLFRKIIFQTVIIYDKYESCLNRVEPFKSLSAPLMAKKETKGLFRVKNEELLRNFKERNGMVKRRLLVYVNRSKYDTRIFKNILGGINNDKKA